MKEIIIRNALIESLSIDMGGRGILTAWLNLDYGDGSHQGFGGFTLYLPKNFAHHNDRGNHAGHFLYRCMEIAGVENFKDLVGKSIRVQCSKAGLGGKILAIGHIIKEDWFSPEFDFQRIKM